MTMQGREVGGNAHSSPTFARFVAIPSLPHLLAIHDRGSNLQRVTHTMTSNYLAAAIAVTAACAITSSYGETLKLAKEGAQPQAAQLAAEDLNRSDVRFLVVEGAKGPIPGLDAGCVPRDDAYTTAIAPDGDEQRATAYAQSYNAAVVSYLVANKKAGRFVRCR
jgi:hypothetical protein